MRKIRDAIKGVSTFVTEVHLELKKCAWPSKPELMESTVMVIVASLLLGVFVGISDFGLLKFLGAVIR